jgi:outer membrane protein OmpA-like peptidoglycan-associated protein
MIIPSIRVVLAALVALAAPCVAMAQTYDDAHDAYARSDYAAAYKGLPALADRGDPRAQLLLADLYDGGLGVKRDPIRAYMWCEIALSILPKPMPDTVEHQRTQGRCSILKLKLTAYDLSVASDLAKAWRPAGTDGPRRFLLFFDFEIPNMTMAASENAELALLKVIATDASEIDIVGHSDTAEAHSLALSLERAKTVATFMSKRGLPGSVRVHLSGSGTADQLVKTGPHDREPQNRFVIITLR